MPFHRTSIFLNADDRKIVSVLQKRYGLSTMSETLRFALRLATAFAPTTSQRIVPSGGYKPICTNLSGKCQCGLEKIDMWR